MTASGTPKLELKAVRSVVIDYLDGTYYADEIKIRRAFHPRCLQFGHYRGQFLCDTVDQYVDWLKGEKAIPAGAAYDAEILSVEVTGDIAAVSLIANLNGTRFTDYLTLVKSDGRWAIVTKTFYAHPDKKQARERKPKTP